ncbi:MAG: heme exporter protein CcmB [Solirubrobacteraceae bacterium]
MRAFGALLRKDLRIELRRPETVPAMALFSVTTLIVLHFGFQRARLEGDLAAGALLITVLFAAVLGINRLFVAEREEGGLDGFLLAPVDRTSLLFAKGTVLFSFLVVVQVVAVPAFGLLLLGPSLLPALPGLVAVLALVDLGLAIVGTLVGALAVQTRARDLIVPIIGLPLLVPVLIAAARASTPLLLQAGPGSVPLKWMAVLALYDLVFGLIAFAVFDFLLED